MTSTVLHGLNDEDIPEKFTDELLIAVGDECMARPAVLLNALLLAGWLPPSQARARAKPSGVPYANPCGRHFETRGGWWGHCVLTTPHGDDACEAPDDERDKVQAAKGRQQ